MKKHILFVVENAPVPLDKRVWGEALAAKEWGYEVSIVSPKMAQEARGFERLDGIDVYRHPMPVEADGKLGFFVEYLNSLIWEFFLSLNIFVKKRFHAIHSANPPDHFFVIALLFKIFGTKYVFDHHDITPENYLAKFGKRDFLYKFLFVMEKLTFKVADIVISTNESYKKIAIDRGGKKDNEVFVVRNGPDLSKIIFMPPNNDLRRGFDHLVAYIGNIGSQEDIDVLLRVVRHIVYVKEIKNIKFIIIGTGPHWKKIVKLSRDMGLTKYVRFTGFIPYEQAYEILATADVCVNPEHKSSFTDKSTMIKIMDYMVFAKPIVQFETTEGKVTAGGAAVYVKRNDDVDFAEAIIDLLNSRKKRERMGEIGRRRIYEKLTWDKQKVNLKRAYDYLEAKP